jgi:hypothetical protein
MYPGPFPNRPDRPCCGDKLSRTRITYDISNHRACQRFCLHRGGRLRLEQGYKRYPGPHRALRRQLQSGSRRPELYGRIRVRLGDYVRSRVGDRFSFQLVAGNHEDDFGGDGHISEFASCLPDRMDSVNLLIPNEKGSAAGVGGCPLASGAHTALRTVIPFPLLADASRASLFFSWH